MAPTKTTPPKRIRAGDVIDAQQELLERLATKTPYTAEPKIELDYKKAPGDPVPRVTSHIEIPAGFDQAELDRMKLAAFALQDEILDRYAVREASNGA